MCDKTRWILFVLVGILFSCQIRHNDTRFLTYNVQNLFDEVTDGSEYAEFRAYEQALYEQHLVNLTTVFEQINRKYGKLGVVFLQEVENEKAVKALVENTPSLKDMQVLFTKEPNQAIGVGMLVRYPIMAVEVFNPSTAQHKDLRSILSVVLTIKGQNVGVITSHLPSQRSAANVASRQHVLRQMGLSGQRLVDEYGEMPLVMAGDFNLNLAAPENNEVAQSLLMSAKEGQETFFNPWPALARQRREQGEPVTGSYAFRGEWTALDGFLLSESLISGTKLRFVEMFPVGFEWLVVPDSRYEGAIHPHAFGVKSTQGFSDHLPVMAVFK